MIPQLLFNGWLPDGPDTPYLHTFTECKDCPLWHQSCSGMMGDGGCYVPNETLQRQGLYEGFHFEYAYQLAMLIDSDEQLLERALDIAERALARKHQRRTRMVNEFHRSIYATIHAARKFTELSAGSMPPTGWEELFTHYEATLYDIRSHGE